jgi:membrane protein implicated in regulation of membrane protease activity
VVGLLAWLGLVESAAVQWLLFSVVSLVFLFPLRGRLVRWIGSGEDVAKGVDALVGQTAVLLDDPRPARSARRSCAARPGTRATPTRTLRRDSAAR